MATYKPGDKSPDRMDAMVWAMRELFNIDSKEGYEHTPSAYVFEGSSNENFCWLR